MAWCSPSSLLQPLSTLLHLFETTSLNPTPTVDKQRRHPHPHDKGSRPRQSPSSSAAPPTPSSSPVPFSIAVTLCTTTASQRHLRLLTTPRVTLVTRAAAPKALTASVAGSLTLHQARPGARDQAHLASRPSPRLSILECADLSRSEPTPVRREVLIRLPVFWKTAGRPLPGCPRRSLCPHHHHHRPRTPPSLQPLTLTRPPSIVLCCALAS